MCLPIPTMAGPCSEEGMQVFRSSGFLKAEEKFNLLLEEPRCQAEPEFLANLGQLYKARLREGLNGCRAWMAYRDALKSKALSGPYPRVAADGINTAGPICTDQRALLLDPDHEMRERLPQIEALARAGRPRQAFREYRLLRQLFPNDRRPLNAFCKLARKIGQQHSHQECQVRNTVTAVPDKEESGVGANWVFGALAVVSTGAAVWQGIETKMAHDDAWSKNQHLTREGNSLSDSEFAQLRSSVLKDSEDAERHFQVTAALGAVAIVTGGIAVYYLYTDDSSEVSLSPTGQLVISGQF